nr:YetF domain-containing protein [Paenibacillus sp. AR247]
MEDNLKKERLTNEELMEQLRGKNAFKTAEVEFAIMEPNGQINVLMKKKINR